MKKLIFLLIIVTNIFAINIPDYAKESRWATQVEDSLMDGDIVKISGADKDFIGIFTESEDSSNKAAIIIHGIGIHPDWATVINPLRVSLTTQKYNTLSIQMPVLENGINSSEYRGLMNIASGRIAMSVDYLEENGYEIDTIIAHSLGTTMASNYLANVPNPIANYISIGAGFYSIENLKIINTNILDLYGTDDIKVVLDSAKKRQNAAKHNQDYSQKIITGDHFFTNNTQGLIDTVHNWINNL